MLAFKTHLGRCLSLGLIIALAGTGTVSASTEADQLRAELEALKIENAKQAERMRVLEERLRALEAAAQPPPRLQLCPEVVGVPSGRAGAADALASVNRARVRIDKEYQHDTESREQSLLTAAHPYAGRVQEVLQGFMDIHGYFRAAMAGTATAVDGRIPGAGRERQVSARQ
jgi:hypothetical protein